MNPAIVVSGIALTALIWAAITLVRRLGSTDSRLPVTAEWIDELSLDRYRPMMRLLNSDDIAFLRSQPGFTPKMESTLRAQRCQIFRGYLRCLDTDFQRICIALKLLLVESAQDRPELSSALIQQQIMFASALLAVNASPPLLLSIGGIGTVDVTALVRIFDATRIELRTLVPSRHAWRAH